MTPPYNLARFDLISIRLVVDSVHHGSLSAAARGSHLALAAASRRVRELEDAIGEPLFERHGRGLRPTPAGQVFARHGLALLQSLDQLAGELADLRQGVARHIRLCANSAAISEFLPPLLAEHARRERQVRIELEEQLSSGVVLALREGRADVGVFAEGPPSEGLSCRLFRRDELVLVLPAGHRLAGRTPLPLADALDEDWITLGDGAALLLRLQQSALAQGRPLRIRMQVRSFDAVCHLVAVGMGIAVLPRQSVRALAGPMKLSLRTLADGWGERSLLVATRAGTVEPAVQQLVDFLAEGSQNANARRRA